MHNVQWSYRPVTAVTEFETDLGATQQDHPLQPGETWIGERDNPIIGYRIDEGANLEFRADYTDLRTQRPLRTDDHQTVEAGLYRLDPTHQAQITVYPVGDVEEPPPFAHPN